MLRSLQRYCKAIIRIQKFCVYWKNNIKNPKTKAGIRRHAVGLLQKYLRGYQVRRKYMYDLLNLQADKMYEPFRIIDIIARGHF
jgi:hypothetical protein